MKASSPRRRGYPLIDVFLLAVERGKKLRSELIIDVIPVVCCAALLGVSSFKLDAARAHTIL